MQHEDEQEANATLSVVLSFLDECEQEEAAKQTEKQQTHQEAVVELVDAHSAAQRKKRRPPKRAPGYKPNRARDDRRFELIHLRETVCSLEKELEDLRTQDSTRQLALGPVNKAQDKKKGQVPSLESAFSMWEGVASRQLEERKRAELENVRLKDFLEQQIQVATALQKLIHRRTTWEAILKGSRRSTLTKSTSESNATKFQDLIEGAERALANVDAVMQATGLNKNQPPFSDARVRSDANGENSGMVIEIVSTKQLPFDLQATGRAVWRHFAHAMESLPSRVYYPQHVETTGDTVMEQFDLEIENDATAGYHVRQVLRKREEPQRILISWRCVMEMISFAGEPTTGILLPEDGYIVLKRSMQSHATVMQMCYVITPDVYMHNASRMGKLTDFILHTVLRTIQASHQLIENFLLDHAMREAASS